MCKRLLPFLLLGVALASPWAGAQQSASYTLTESSFNAGGDPHDGTAPSSMHFRMTLDALGEAVSARALRSSSFAMEGGFVSGFPPPGEVHELTFSGPAAMVWAAEGSAGTYNVYRDRLSLLTGLGFGTCLQAGLTAPATEDPEPPPLADGWFYLVTAENRLQEEGTKGRGSSGDERPNLLPCP